MGPRDQLVTAGVGLLHPPRLESWKGVWPGMAGEEVKGEGGVGSHLLALGFLFCFMCMKQEGKLLIVWRLEV